jgi:hypothetical protein
MDGTCVEDKWYYTLAQALATGRALQDGLAKKSRSEGDYAQQKESRLQGLRRQKSPLGLMYTICITYLRAHDSRRLHVCKLHNVNEHYFYQILSITPHASGDEQLLHLLPQPVFSMINRCFGRST